MRSSFTGVMAALCASYAAASSAFGSCPDLTGKAMDSLDINRYGGRWYHVATDTDNFSEDEYCIVSDLVVHHDTTTTVGVNKYTVDEHAWGQQIFHVVQSNANTSEFVSFKEGEDHTIKAEEPGHISVLGTDYENWTIEYVC